MYINYKNSYKDLLISMTFTHFYNLKLSYTSIRDVTRSREIRLVSRERDDILAKYLAMFTLELHN